MRFISYSNITYTLLISRTISIQTIYYLGWKTSPSIWRENERSVQNTFMFFTRVLYWKSVDRSRVSIYVKRSVEKLIINLGGCFCFATRNGFRSVTTSFIIGNEMGDMAIVWRISVFCFWMKLVYVERWQIGEKGFTVVVVLVHRVLIIKLNVIL